MWKKLYSNSGLILLAILAAGVWFSNLRALHPRQPDKSPGIDALTSPTPRNSAVELYEQEQNRPRGRGPRLSAVELYEQEQAQKRKRLTIDEALKRPVVSQASSTPSVYRRFSSAAQSKRYRNMRGRHV